MAMLELTYNYLCAVFVYELRVACSDVRVLNNLLIILLNSLKIYISKVRSGNACLHALKFDSDLSNYQRGAQNLQNCK
jgi:hypothetical protein